MNSHKFVTCINTCIIITLWYNIYKALPSYQGKVFIFCHVVDELFFSTVVCLEVVVHVTKPVELVLIVNQLLVAQLLFFHAFVIVMATEPKIELESRYQGLELLLCCNKSL